MTASVRAPAARGSLLLMSLLVSCTKSEPAPAAAPFILASSFRQDCERGNDCTPVVEGPITCCGLGDRCPNAAIRNEPSSDYEGQARARAPLCVDRETCPFTPNCPPSVLVCPHGTCEFHAFAGDSPEAAALTTVSTDGYGRACETVDDCVAVYAGRLACCGSQCANTAIRQDELSRYMSDVGAHTPSCSPITCKRPGPCGSRRISCENGVCELLGSPPDAAADDAN